MKFDKDIALGFIIGYFIFAFILFYWQGFFSIHFLFEKLVWVDIGLFATILLGLLYDKIQKKPLKNGNV